MCPLLLQLCLLPAAFAQGGGIEPAPGPADTAPVLTPMHGAVASFGAASTPEAIYVLGGHVGGAHEHSRDNLSARFVRYPLDDPSGFEELPGGVGLQSVALVARGDELYRVGGMYARNAPGEDDDLHSVSTFARYDFGSGEWTSVAALPSARSSHDAIFLGDTLYVVGGWKLDGSGQEWLDESWRIDLSVEQPEWSSFEQPFRRRALAVASAYGKIYAIGGLTADGDTSARIDVYDPSSETWEQGPDLPVTGFGATAFGTDEGLFFLGRDGHLWRLDDGAERWTAVRSLAFPRFFSRLVPAGAGRLAILGGAAPEGRPALLEIVPTEPTVAETTISSLALRFPGNTRQRQTAFVHDNRLYLFGGNLHAEAHHFEPEDFGSEGWSLDLLEATWREEAPFPARRQSMQAALVDGASPTAFVAGGYGPDAEGPRSWSDAHVFDLTSRTWHAAPVELPLALTQFGWLATDDALWTAGGIAYHPDRDGDFTRGDALYRWKLGDEAGFVEAGVRLKSKRRAFGSTRIGDALYVVGGMHDDFQAVEDPERVNLATGEVRTISRPPTHRLGPSVTGLGDKLYLTGGTSRGDDGRAFDTSLECYDPATDTWTVLADSLPVTAQHLRVTAWGERLIAFSTARDGWIDIAFITPPGARAAHGGFSHP